MLYLPLPVGRVCRICGMWKPCAELKRRKISADGVDAQCRKCNAALSLERYTAKREEICAAMRLDRTQNPDKYRERDRKRRKNPARHEYMLLYSHQYYFDNREYFAERGSRYAKEHPEVFRKAGKKWSAANQDKVKLYKRRYRLKHPENAAKHVKLARQRHPEVKQAAEERRRARKRNLPDTFTADDWRRCLNYWHGCCAVCGRPAGLWHTIAADHWIPLSDLACPGTVPSNMLPLCHSQRLGDNGCNNTKWAHDPAEWLSKKLGSRTQAKLREIEAYFASLS